MKLDKENVFTLNIILFSVVAILHFVRLILTPGITVGGYELPLWVSILGLIVLVFLIWQNWIHTKRTKVTCAKIVTGIIIVDLLGIMSFWVKGIEFLGFKGTEYAVFAATDIVIIALLIWYIKRNQ